MSAESSGKKLDDISSTAKEFLDGLLPFVLLSLGSMIVFQFAFPVSTRIEHYITFLNWGFMFYFGLRLAVDYRLRDDNEDFWRNHWMDILLVIPLFSILQEVEVFAVAEESAGISEVGEHLVTAPFLRNSQAAAKLTRIARIIRRSLDL